MNTSLLALFALLMGIFSLAAAGATIWELARQPGAKFRSFRGISAVIMCMSAIVLCVAAGYLPSPHALDLQNRTYRIETMMMDGYEQPLPRPLLANSAMPMQHPLVLPPTPPVTKVVPMSEIEDLAAQIRQLQKEVAEARKSAEVQPGTKLQKVETARQEWDQTLNSLPSELSDNLNDLDIAKEWRQEVDKGEKTDDNHRTPYNSYNHPDDILNSLPEINSETGYSTKGLEPKK